MPSRDTGGAAAASPLGEVWSYNNSAFNIAGRVIETVAGTAYEDALRELELTLGLEAAYFFADEVITYRVAVGHERDEEKKTVPARPWAIGRSSHPAGGLITTVPELLKYARFWIDGGDFSSASVEEMTRPQIEVGGNIDAVGLAWMITWLGDVRLIGHGGGTKDRSPGSGSRPTRVRSRWSPTRTTEGS